MPISTHNCNSKITTVDNIIIIIINYIMCYDDDWRTNPFSGLWRRCTKKTCRAQGDDIGSSVTNTQKAKRKKKPHVAYKKSTTTRKKMLQNTSSLNIIITCTANISYYYCYYRPVDILYKIIHVLLKSDSTCIIGKFSLSRIRFWTRYFPRLLWSFYLYF